MMKHGDSCTVEKMISAEFEFGVIAPWVRTPQTWRWVVTLGKSAQVNSYYYYYYYYFLP